MQSTIGGKGSGLHYLARTFTQAEFGGPHGTVKVSLKVLILQKLRDHALRSLSERPIV